MGMVRTNVSGGGGRILELERQIKNKPKKLLTEELIYPLPEYCGDTVKGINASVISTTINPNISSSFPVGGGFHTLKYPFFTLNNGAWTTGAYFYPILFASCWRINTTGTVTYVTNYVAEIRVIAGANDTTIKDRYLFKFSSPINASELKDQPLVLFADTPLKIQQGNVLQMWPYIEALQGGVSSPKSMYVNYMVELLNKVYL